VEDEMTRALWSIVFTGLLALAVGRVPAQDAPAAPAPTPPGEGAVDHGAPALPDEGHADRKARIEALRARWQDMAVAPRSQGIQMQVQGESIYILYGTVLLQLSAETLELKAKVDLRELVLGDRELAKHLRKERPEKPPLPAPAEP
jgi:hypothetical protein